MKKVIDDTTLDKSYGRAMALVSRHGTGKHHEVVQEINLISLVWSDGDAAFPCDFRLYNKAEDGLSKNDHFRVMLETAQARGFAPNLAAFDTERVKSGEFVVNAVGFSSPFELALTCS